MSKDDTEFNIEDPHDLDKIMQELDSEGPKKRKKRAPNVKKGEPKPPKENYVNELDFRKAIEDFYASGVMTDELGTMVYKIANGLSHRPNFINYSFREEFVSDAMVNMIKALNGKKFDPTRGFNPFSYFTCIAFHTFCTRIKKEKKHRDAVEAYQEEHYPELMGNNTSQANKRSANESAE